MKISQVPTIILLENISLIDRNNNVNNKYLSFSHSLNANYFAHFFTQFFLYVIENKKIYTSTAHLVSFDNHS